MVRGILVVLGQSLVLTMVTYPWVFQLLLLIAWKIIWIWVFGGFLCSPWVFSAEFLLTAVKLHLISRKRTTWFADLCIKTTINLIWSPLGYMSHMQVFCKSFFSHEYIPVKVVLKANFCLIGIFQKTKHKCSVPGRYILVPSCFECSFDVKSLFNPVLCH